MNSVAYQRSSFRGRENERLRTIIFAAPKAAIPEQIKEIIEFEFPWTAVVDVGSINDAASMFSHTVSLILVHEDLLSETEEAADMLYKYHPLSLIAALDCGDTLQHLSRQILRSKVFRGVLPIHARVEVWLSIMSLLMRGVGYFPREMFEEQVGSSGAQPAPFEAAPAQRQLPKPLLDLTQREMEVLELVERGLPNKSIANNLNISAHTVKIHLHNIISKLGTQNRTGAAAFLHNARLAPEQRRHSTLAQPDLHAAANQ